MNRATVTRDHVGAWVINWNGENHVRELLIEQVRKQAHTEGVGARVVLSERTGFSLEWAEQWLTHSVTARSWRVKTSRLANIYTLLDGVGHSYPMGLLGQCGVVVPTEADRYVRSRVPALTSERRRRLVKRQAAANRAAAAAATVTVKPVRSTTPAPVSAGAMDQLLRGMSGRLTPELLVAHVPAAVLVQAAVLLTA